MNEELLPYQYIIIYDVFVPTKPVNPNYLKSPNTRPYQCFVSSLCRYFSLLNVLFYEIQFEQK